MPESMGNSYKNTANLDESNKINTLVHLEGIVHSGYGPYPKSTGNNHGNWRSFIQIFSFPMKIC